MKRKYIGKLAALLLAAVIAGCGKGKDKQAAHGKAGHASHELVVDSSFTALLKPVNAQVIAEIPLVQADSGMRVFATRAHGVVTYDSRSQVSLSSRVGGRIETLHIKYNYQPVRKGQLVMEIYSPELAAAQRELLMLARHDDHGLVEKAKQRLSLLGMNTGQIEEVIRSGEVLYKVPVFSPADGYILEKSAETLAAASVPAPSMGGDGGMAGMDGGSSVTATPAAPAATASPLLLRPGQYVTAGQTLFTIYTSQSLIAEFALLPAISSHVGARQKVLFYAGADKKEIRSGKIGLIEPVLRNGENFTLARVYLKGHELVPGQIVTAVIPVVFQHGFWLDRKAVLKTGGKSIVFRKQGEVLTPTAITTGITMDGITQVMTDISGWSIASNASYLIDSEGFIKENTVADI